MHRCLALLLIALALQASAGEAFRDSLDVLADRIAERMAAHGHTTIALLSITDERGETTALGEHIGSELMHRLLIADRNIVFVERAMLGFLLDEQRLAASGITRENGDVRLGELKEAGVLLTGTITTLDRRTARLDIRSIDTSIGVVEGSWRCELMIPNELERMERARAIERQREAQRADREAARSARAVTNAERNSWIGAAIVATEYFGQWRPGIAFDLRKDARLTLGVRSQWNMISGYAPQKVEFGHFELGEDSFMHDDLFSDAGSGQGGEVYLVPANNADHGARLLMEAMDQGVNSAAWSQVRSTISSGHRFSLMLPLRVKLGAATQRVRPFIDLGYGLDLVHLRTEHEGWSIKVDRTFYDEYTVIPGTIGWQGAFNGSKQGLRSWNMLIGGGVEIGRVSFTAEWRHAFHAEWIDGGRKVIGDPVAIALLNGPAIEDDQVMSTIAREGALRFARLRTNSVIDEPATMDRFLDRSHFQIGVTVRF